LEEKYLSIIIPAYNEEKRLGKTLETILNYLKKKGYSYEIIIVNDGSTDGTVDIAQEFIKFDSNMKIINNDKNMGKGYSVKRGVLEASGEYILFTDSDLSTPIEEFKKLLTPLESGYDIAIGSRSMKESNVVVHQPFYREIIGKIFNKLVKAFVVKGFIDTQCGFKLFKKDAAKNIFNNQKLNGFSFDVEILYLAIKDNLKIKEVPIKWFNSPKSHVSLVGSSYRMFMELLKIKRIHSKTLQ